MIPMNDFRADPPELITAEVSAVERVLQSGWYVLGREVLAFEDAWARTCGTSAAIGVGNGLDAIEIILRALGIGVGDEVITTPMTAFATVLAVLRSGATPVLADIDPETGILDLESAKRCVTGRTRAVILVHLYGRLVRMDSWQSLATQFGLHLVEDCAQSHLARRGADVAGSFGVAGAYSFYPTKNLGCPGDGGAVVTSSTELAASARRLRNYGQSERYHHELVGMNSRLDEVHAAMLSERLTWLERFTWRRRAIAERYFAEIRSSHLQLLAAPDEPAAHVHHLFVLRTVRRDDFMAHLRARGVESLAHYPVAIHEQPPCRALPRDPEGLRRAEAHARTCVSIPLHHNLQEGQVERVIEAVNSYRA